MSAHQYPLHVANMQAMHKGEWGGIGELIEIDIAENDTPIKIKEKLVKPTGIPIEHMKLRCGGVSQLMFGDKRTNIVHGTCGMTQNVGLTYV
eukprot:gene10639-12584_t